jgi:hypothetical protein
VAAFDIRDINGTSMQVMGPDIDNLELPVRHMGAVAIASIEAAASVEKPAFQFEDLCTAYLASIISTMYQKECF